MAEPDILCYTPLSSYHNLNFWSLSAVPKNTY
jgi:hypothetical protein